MSTNWLAWADISRTAVDSTLTQARETVMDFSSDREAQRLVGMRRTAPVREPEVRHVRPYAVVLVDPHLVHVA